MCPDRDRAAAQLESLERVVTAAKRLVADLVADPLLDRLLRAFYALPEADREPIVGVLEKDASWRRIVEETAGTTGIDVRPNPHASLYVHVLDQATGQPVALEAPPRDAAVIRRGIETFVPLIPLLFQERVRAQWTAVARTVVRQADAGVRAAGARLAEEVLALIAEADDASR
jgi:hypothetical protein